ncbi:YfaP family protein [Vibrio crassostreae]|uniref:YfaP family protein n=1 Tax=Vibrio crassostreae TaxID=246167 RepID=UPI001B31698D|nr:hypothetical protein [Vibrio crassostreae]
MDLKIAPLAMSLMAAIAMPVSASLNGCLVEPTDKETYIYFANGVDNEYDDVLKVVRLLKDEYENQLNGLADNEKYQFSDAYNYTQGVLKDILQVFKQKQDELGVNDDNFHTFQLYEMVKAGLTSDEIRIRILLMTHLTDNTGLAAKITDSALNELEQAIDDAIVQVLADQRTVNEESVTKYETALQSGKRVIILAHSQGNLFTNSAITSVMQRNPQFVESIASIGVASPADSVIGANKYITAEDDRVIQALALLENVLPLNLDNDPSVFNDFRTISNHEFIKDYFDDRLVSKTWIDGEVVRLATNLPYPSELAGEGALRASMSWGAEPDVDLHVFEPDGTHVHYRNRVGTSGELDVDDTNSFGPENFFVECNDIMLGTYSIGVNYYSGNAPEKAEITLFLGDGQSVKPRTKTLSSERGSDGNDNPEIMFEVNVSENENGLVTYEIL